jgi:hypothetical protein
MAHREAVEDAIKNHDRLDALTVYQPIRFEVEFSGRLKVLGVEDEQLYQADRMRLSRLRELSRQLKQSSKAFGASQQKELNDLVAQIHANADMRGQQAAENLLKLMKKEGVSSSTLLLGGGHAAGAIAFLQSQSVRVWTLIPHSYNKAPGAEGS